jgi:hypothetical protein
MNEQGSEEQKQVQAFNPNEHIIQLKSRQGAQDYLPVQWRLVWFRGLCPNGTIETELVHLDLDKETEEETFVWNNEKRRSEKVVKTAKGLAIFRATVTDGKGGKATGTKMEKAASFGDYIEKSEGRALAALGYGTQFAPEFSEAHRIVDSPVDRTPNVSESGTSYSTNGSNGSGNGHATLSPVRPVNANGANGTNGNVAQNSTTTTTETTQANQPEKVTEQQLTSIHKLCDYLGKQEPEGVASMSFLEGKKIIQQLTAEYRQSKKAS